MAYCFIITMIDPNNDARRNLVTSRQGEQDRRGISRPEADLVSFRTPLFTS